MTLTELSNASCLTVTHAKADLDFFSAAPNRKTNIGLYLVSHKRQAKHNMKKILCKVAIRKIAKVSFVFYLKFTNSQM